MIMPYQTLNCNGKLVSLEHPAVMGIVNINPDSFYAPSRVTAENLILQRVGSMVEEGAAIVDLGAMSSRPGAKILSADEEWNRLSRVLQTVRKQFPQLLISIDTIHSSTAHQALDIGVDIINDISGGTFDSGMLRIVGKYDVPMVIMHMQGRPENMQQNPRYENVVAEVFDFFVSRIAAAEEAGIVDLILDPGFGFGKSLEHNFELLQNLHAFEILRYPILAGVSRKGMIQKSLGVDAAHALNGTTAVHMLALLRGARILRVHDVGAAVECIKIWEKFNDPGIDGSGPGPYILA